MTRERLQLMLKTTDAWIKEPIQQAEIDNLSGTLAGMMISMIMGSSGQMDEITKKNSQNKKEAKAISEECNEKALDLIEAINVELRRELNTPTTTIQ